jgi:hypothetical protein
LAEARGAHAHYLGADTPKKRKSSIDSLFVATAHDSQGGISSTHIAAGYGRINTINVSRAQSVIEVGCF